ncbi:MAG: tRNA (adenosine(37)-N6)-dimethylallyltransferase MiaA [Alphaproteobacteria bacterium]
MSTYIICGPTASGKSALALDIACHLKGHVLNADSMQLYKELPILSAQPFLIDQQKVPHLLYGSFSVTERGSVGKWLTLVEHNLKTKDISCPVFVGGTGLYINALLEGLSPIPDTPPDVRAKLTEILSGNSPEYMFNLLKTQDPLTASQIDPHNTHRILRALEVIQFTKKPLAEWQQIPREKKISFPSPIKVILIEPDRQALHKVINNRVEQMIDKGAIKEVLKLKDNHILPSTTACKTIGYEDIYAYLRGYLSQEEMIEQIQQKTRQYAKRQITWFRHQIKPDFIWPKIYHQSDWPTVLSEMKW